MHAIQKMNALMMQSIIDIENHKPERAIALIKESLTLLTTNNMMEFSENYTILAPEKVLPKRSIFSIVTMDKENYLMH